MTSRNSDAALSAMDDAVVDETESGDYDTSHDETTDAEDRDGDTSTAEREKKEKEEIQNLIKRENKSVLTWRETVTGILMIIGFIAGMATFVFLGREENTAFQNAVSNIATVPIMSDRVLLPFTLFTHLSPSHLSQTSILLCCSSVKRLW